MSGGGGSSAPTQQNITTTNIPEYARPYVEKSLGQAAALTDINNNPYQPYQGQRIAEFSPLQSQAFTSLGDMQIAPQLAQATGYANQATQGGLASAPIAYGYGAQGSRAGQTGQEIGTTGGMGIGSQATGLAGRAVDTGAAGMAAGMGYGQQAQNPYAVQGYMNPYLQAALQPQLQEMQRQYGISGAQGQSNATKAGAFGGSREALIFAENQRNKNLAMNQAIGQGYNTAYDVANRNMQAASQLGMQGAGVGLAGLSGANQLYGTGLQGVNTALAGTAQGMQGAGMGLQGVQGAQNAYNLGLQGANTLTNIGNAQFAQQMSIADAQMRAGAAQQAQAQRGLDIPYQEYQEQLNYPYKQLAFQSDMFRGLPLSQSATTMYQNTGAMMPQILGAGIAAYGATAGRGAKEGGMVKGYAAGGGVQVDPRALSSVSPASLPSKLSRLSDDQLMAYARTVKDPAAREEVQAEMNRRAEMRQSQQATQAQEAQAQEAQGGIGQQPMMAAGGGIVALAGGGDGKDNPGEYHMDTPEVATQTPDWTRRFPEGSLIRRLRVPVGSDVRNTLASQTQSGDSAVQPGTISPAAVAVLNQAQQAQDVDSAVQPGTISPAGIAALNQAQQAQDADSAVQPGTISREDLVAMGEAQQMQGVDSQVQPYGGITSAPAATAATGTPTAATSGIPAAAPAGTTTATGTPTAAAPSSGGITPAGGAPAGGGVGTVGIPVGVPGDPMSFATYRANVQDLAKLDPEEKAVLANMEARTLKRLSRAETQEKGVMNEAFVAAGLAMMGGLNLADGVRRAAESGGKQYFASKAEARKAIDKAEEAQDSFDQYRVALKQGNKKLANEMYGTFYKSYTDYVGKIQAAGISAGASLENAKATREATAEYRAQESRRHDLDRDATMQRHRENINANREQFDIRMQELGNTRDIQRLGVLDKRYEAALEGQRRVRKDMEALLIKEKEAINFSADKPEIKKRKLEALQTDFNAKLAAELRPYKDQAADFLNQQDALISSALSGFKVTNVRPN
jgi:hypothetical protein